MKTRVIPMAMAVMMALAGAAYSGVYYVKPNAPAHATGASWSEAMPFTNAMAAAAASTDAAEIWVAGTNEILQAAVTYTLKAPLTIRGGFAGTETDAWERPAGTVSVIDGISQYQTLVVVNPAAAPLAVERMVFVNSVMNGLCKTGGGNLTVESCIFRTNGLRATSSAGGTGSGTDGKGIRVSSASGATITVRDSTFRANRQTAGDAGGPGAALMLSGCTKAVVENCGFFGNSLPLLVSGTGASSGNPLGDKFTMGSAIYASVPTTVTGCRFSANICIIGSNWNSDSGGTIWFNAGSAGSVVSNCLFHGNHDRASWNNGGRQGGAISVNFGNKTDVLTVTGSTFAYNLTDGKFSSGGINIQKGTVNLDNCVFGGNMVTPSALTPSADLRLTANAVCNVSYTVFGYDKGYSIYSDGTLNEGTGVVYKDPCFVTDFTSISNLVTFGTSYTYFEPTQAVYDALYAIDAHLLSAAGYVTNGDPATWLQADGIISPAIDAGHGDYSNEPMPNGGCRNAGFYGNTPQASKTYQSRTPLGFTDIAVTYPDGYSRPQVSYTVTGDAGCVVAVTASAAGDGIDYSELFAGCIAGETYSFLLPTYYPRGTGFTVSLSGTSSAGPVTPASASFTVDADLPVWWGRGGGAHVLHVWSGAPGDNSGRDWHNACRAWNDLVAAYAATNSIREIWFVDMASPIAAPSTLTVVTNLAFRGGFRNTEDSPSDRTPGTRATMDSYNLFGLFKVKNAGHKVEVERLDFIRSSEQGFVKTGAGDIEFRDCGFYSNYRDIGANANGRGLHVTGTTGTTLVTLSNCVFRGNGMFAGGGYNLGYGAGAYFANCARVTLDDCLFVTNGVSLAGAGANYGGDRSYGTAIYATSAPLTARNCRFISNHGTCRESNLNGGAVRLEGACNGSALTNCLFAGNSDRCGWLGSTPGYHGGAVVVKMANTGDAADLVNCTFAYNLADGTTSAGGLNVYKGTVNVKNSIFHGNMVGQRTVSGYDKRLAADIDVKAEGICNVSYTMLSTNANTSFDTADGGVLNLGAGVIFGDPLLVTTTNEVIPKVSGLSGTGYIHFMTGAENLGWLTTINCHLRGKFGYRDETTGELVKFSKVMSPAIDAGDPAMSAKGEASPSGGRVNLGFYGNTPWATMSPVRGLTIIVH